MSRCSAEEGFRVAFFNNILWVIFVPAASTFLGLLVAQLTDRLNWGNIAKSLIFMPMAISFVGASLIWKFVYANDPAIGIINAVRDTFGMEPVDVAADPVLEQLLHHVHPVWIQTGFAMVILSAALRGIPEETIEAAIIDGANPFQIFFKIKIPQILPTILVVWTTITILVLKVFDIVYAMTGGNFDTEILPSYMMDYMFRDDGRATAVAFVIMIMVTAGDDLEHRPGPPGNALRKGERHGQYRRTEVGPFHRHQSQRDRAGADLADPHRRPSRLLVPGARADLGIGLVARGLFGEPGLPRLAAGRRA